MNSFCQLDFCDDRFRDLRDIDKRRLSETIDARGNVRTDKISDFGTSIPFITAVLPHGYGRMRHQGFTFISTVSWYISW